MHPRIAIPALLLALAAPGCVSPGSCPAAPLQPSALELEPTTPEVCPDLLGLPVVLPDCFPRAALPEGEACELGLAWGCQGGGDRPPGAFVEVTPSAPLAWDGEAWTGEGTAVASDGSTGATCTAAVRIRVTE